MILQATSPTLSGQGLKSALLAGLLFSSHSDILFAAEPSFEPLLAPVLKEAAETPYHTDWITILEDRKAYLQSLDQILKHCDHLLDIGLTNVLEAQGVPASDPGINPWAPFDQETGFIPQIDSVLWHPREESKTPPNPILHEILPAQYRLAEQLGIGNNALHLTPRFVDPKFQSRVPYGFSVSSRILHELYGTFTWQGTNQVETFRYQIESVSRSGSGTANLGTGVKPHHVGLLQEKIENTYNQAPFRAWETENLQQRILNEGRPLAPSGKKARAQAAILHRLERSIRTQLHTWTTEIEHHAISKLLGSPNLTQFMTHSAGLMKWRHFQRLENIQDQVLIASGTASETAKSLVRSASKYRHSREKLVKIHAHQSAVLAIQELTTVATLHPDALDLWNACLSALADLAIQSPER